MFFKTPHMTAILLCAALAACSKSESPGKAAPKAAAPAQAEKAATATAPAAPAAPPVAAAPAERLPAPNVPFETKLCTVITNSVAKSAAQKKQPAVMFVLESGEVFKDPTEFGRNAAKLDEVAMATCPAERQKFLEMAQSTSLLEALKPPAPPKGK